MFVPLTYLATLARLCCSVISSSLLAKTVHLNLVDLLVVWEKLLCSWKPLKQEFGIFCVQQSKIPESLWLYDFQTLTC